MTSTADPPVEGLRALLRTPGLVQVVAGAFGGNFAQWGSLFIGSFTLHEHGASVLAVQLTAMAAFAPLLLGGAVAGRLAARVERVGAMRRMVEALVVSMIVMALAMALAAPPELVYVATFVSGVGQVGNLTLQRPVLYELAGPAHGPSALAVDALAASLAICLGPLVMGFVLAAGGATAGYLVLAGTFAASRVLLGRVRHRSGPELAPGRREVVAPTERVTPTRTSQALVAVIGVTVIMNLFYFPFLALIPVLAERFTTASSATGILAAAPGLGMVVGNATIALRRPVRLAHVYIGGSAVAMTAMVGMARSPVYAIALAALFVAGLGVSGFSASQAALVLRSSPVERRSQAMGLLSSAIGMLPVGTVAMGLTSQRIGPVTGVTVSGCIGLAVLALWLPVCRPVLGARVRATAAHRDPAAGQAADLAPALDASAPVSTG